jgi:hypothetical protein
MSSKKNVIFKSIPQGKKLGAHGGVTRALQSSIGIIEH